MTAELELGNIALSMDEMGAKRHKIKILQFGVSTANNNIMYLCSQLGVAFLPNSRNSSLSSISRSSKMSRYNGR